MDTVDTERTHTIADTRSACSHARVRNRNRNNRVHRVQTVDIAGLFAKPGSGRWKILHLAHGQQAARCKMIHLPIGRLRKKEAWLVYEPDSPVFGFVERPIIQQLVYVVPGLVSGESATARLV